MEFLLSFSLIWVLAVMTPGPNFFVVMRYSLTGQRKAALATSAGVASGTLVWGVSGWLGISTLFSIFPSLYLALKLFGAAYLSWLGARMLIAAWRNNYAVPSVCIQSNDWKKAYFAGMLTILSNPKTAIVVPALFAASLPHDYSASLGFAAVILLVSISFAWYSLAGVSMTSAAVSGFMRRARRHIDAFSGLAFLGFAGKLVLTRD